MKFCFFSLDRMRQTKFETNAYGIFLKYKCRFVYSLIRRNRVIRMPKLAPNRNIHKPCRVYKLNLNYILTFPALKYK